MTREPLNRQDRRLMTVLRVAFFASGFAALLCQIVWQRMLGVFAGSDTVSAALVVGAFLAGLGLGSIIGAKWADRLTPAQALLGFALAETGVALFALVSKYFLYDWLATGLAGKVDDPAAVFALCFSGLVVPTTLMGLSLPLLSRAVATSIADLAERIGSLYGLNTLGAGLGAIVGGWVLVGVLGFVGTLYLAAAIEMLAVLLALSLWRQLRGTTPPALPKSVGSHGGSDSQLLLWCLLVFISGYVIVALEIVWVRLLGQIGMFHAYLFPTVLGIFLLADGLGIAVASRLMRRTTDPRPAFFLAQGSGFVLAAGLILLAWWLVPEWPLVQWLNVDNERLGIGAYLAMFVLILLVVGPPAFVIGMTFPFVQRAVQHDLTQVGSRVGWVQLANIAGNAAGALVTGLLTLHAWGTAGTIRWLALLSMLLMLGWLWRNHWRHKPEWLLTLACAAIALVLPGNQAFWSRLHQVQEGQTLAWSEDRSGVTLFRGAADKNAGTGGPFFIQGFAQGYIPFLPIHQFLGAVGPLVHPQPRQVLVIGIGSGGTPWAAAARSGSTIRSVELVAPVIDVHKSLARLWPNSPSATMFGDPRWQIIYGDGRRMLAREATQYDVIEADALLPQASLSGQLYSREFLQLVRTRLTAGGLYVQWTPTCRSVDTFRTAFPHSALILPARVMLGSNQPIVLDGDALVRRFLEPGVRQHLARGEQAPFDYSSLVYRVVSFGSDGVAADAPLTDLHPRDEFFGNHKRANLAGGLDKPAAGIEHIVPGTGQTTPENSARPGVAGRDIVPGCPAITGG